MSVIINKYPSRASELLEYLSLIRHAAKYHRGLGWDVYVIKFRLNATANTFLKWSVIDSQLWPKTFTVPSSLMKVQPGPVTSSIIRGNVNRTCHIYNNNVTCAKMCCPYAHIKCNRSRCGKDHLGIKCHLLSEPGNEVLP